MALGSHCIAFYQRRLYVHDPLDKERKILFVADVYLDCLATWNEGNDLYLIGRLRGPGFQSKNEHYRCFVSILQLNILSSLCLYLTVPIFQVECLL